MSDPLPNLRMQLAAGIQPPLDNNFTVSKYDRTGFLWETREPGRDAEDSWESGMHEHATLTDALLKVMPEYQSYSLTLDRAAALCIDLGLILHTGEPIEDLEEEYDEEEGDKTAPRD